MENLKKKQHYVWRNYLKPWLDSSDGIQCYFKDLQKIVNTGLMALAQEKYFYKLECFTKDELVFLRSYIDSFGNSKLHELFIDFYSLVDSFSDLKDPSVDTNIFSSDIKEVEINSLENIHCVIENLGNSVINIRNLSQLKNVVNNELYDALAFMCTQYFRTKKTKDKIITSFNGSSYEVFSKKACDILCIINAFVLAKNISFDPATRFRLLENNTSTPFITGDQPIFNILDENPDSDQEVKELELYYPITPQLAIDIFFNASEKEKCSKKNLCESDVEKYNLKVIANSFKYVFSNNKDLLLKYFSN